MSLLEEKLIRWYQEPAVQAHNWEPRLFWKEVDARHPFGTLKVEPRELEVLEHMATPGTYKQIAKELGVSEETVRSHAKSILEKLKQPNRAQAVLTAMKMRLIKL